MSKQNVKILLERISLNVRNNNGIDRKDKDHILDLVDLALEELVKPEDQDD